MPEEICGRLQKELYRGSDGYAVGIYLKADTKTTFIAVGFLPDCDSQIKMCGAWEENPKHGKQFRLASYELCKPKARGDFISFMAKAKCGIGKVTASKLYEHFGDKVWEELENPTTYTAKLCKQENLEKLHEYLNDNQAMQELYQYFNGDIEISLADVAEIAKIIGGVRWIRDNPYLLCRWVSFGEVDGFAKKKGICKPHAYQRILAAIVAVLEKAKTVGCVCLPENIISEGNAPRRIKGAYQLLNEKTDNSEDKVPMSEITDVLYMAANDKKVIMYNSGHYYLFDTLRQEVLITRTLLNRKASVLKKDPLPVIKQWEKENGMELAEEQRNAILTCLQNEVTIICGNPGTGKTTMIKALCYTAEKCDKHTTIELMAPTGRAAKRMTEATGYPASTVLSAIKYTGKNAEQLLQEQPVEELLCANMIVVDETSMMDMQQMAMFLNKVSAGTRLVFVGDPYQLPSVGAGNVLQDLIQSKVFPVCRLTEIFRQKNQADNVVAINAATIRAGSTAIKYTKNEESAFLYAPASNEEEAIKITIDLYMRCLRNGKEAGIGIDDISLMVPFRNDNLKTALTTKTFNTRLQKIVNPQKGDAPSVTVNGTTFYIGDKVMQVKNVELAKNGDIGYIKDIRRKKTDEESSHKSKREYEVEILFDTSTVTYSTIEMESVDLAYACTVHKMQGSETNTVILVLTEAHEALLARNVVYTAITRASKHVIIIGSHEAFAKAIQNDNTTDASKKRITLLASRLHAQAMQQ